MKRSIVAAFLILAFSSCRDAVGPDGGNTPEGPFVVWFNGLSATADAYFENSDSLINTAWSTGSVPNQIIPTGNTGFAILSSASAEIRFYSGTEAGQTISSVLLPAGSNPYSFVISGATGYATLLLQDSIAVFNPATGELSKSIPANSNPSGIACSGDRLFVGHGNYPESSSPGGVSVLNTSTGELLKWIDTGVNTHWLKLQPSGMLHCYSTTYSNDGRITVIDTETLEITAVVECGGAPGEGMAIGDHFLSPDGWNGGELISYTETGEFSRIAVPFNPTSIALSGSTIYAASFAADMIYLIDSATLTVTDSLQSGGMGPQGIIAIDPSN
jgi:DNA-binding beta-propeller fold protein YncE